MPDHSRRCCRCHSRVKGKMANGYVSWYSENERTTFYTRWCAGCFNDDILPLITQQNANDAGDVEVCVVDGEPVDERREQVFLTLFPPKMEQRDYEFAACSAKCWPELRNKLADGGELRPDRSGGVGARAQAPTPIDDAWAGFKL